MKCLQEKKHRFSLTPRDIKICRYLFATKGALSSQIARDLFNGATRQVVNRRLKTLVREGFLERGSIFKGRAKTLYFVSKKAMKKGFVYNFELPRMELKTCQPFHDLELIDVKRKMQTIECVRHYLMENEIQSDLFGACSYDLSDIKRLNSDAFVQICIDEEVYSGAIELEISDKGKARYAPLFREYYKSETVDFVFYLSDSRAVLNYVLQVDRQVRGDEDPKIFTLSLEDLFQSTDSLAFVNSMGGKLNVPFKKRV